MATIQRDGSFLLGSIRAGSVIHARPGAFGFIAIHPDETPKVIDAAGIRPLPLGLCGRGEA